jgi:hypothetical protein
VGRPDCWWAEGGPTGLLVGLIFNFLYTLHSC